ncbi:MAG TPA: glutaminyl-peptide cyclotransferase, partial [Flavisolibacter sp.]|nr:glutaminyl-peptide cyclotransferase [Flavisolibacter sp.]
MKRSMPLLLLVALLFVKCTNEDTNNGNENNEDRSNVTRLSYTVVAAFPHDTSAFTQGLEFYNGQLLEGTGLEKKSRLIRRNLNDANALQSVFIDSSLFGEGITVLNDTLFQLTWQNQKVLVYTAKDFKKIKEFPLTTEGWGITNNGKELIV